MALLGTNLAVFMGFNTQGDLGGWTFYTSQRGALVFFPKAPPLNPPSHKQKLRQQTFTVAAIGWQNLGEAGRQKWRDATGKANLRITAYNLYTYWSVTKNDAIIETIERQTGISLI